MSRSRLIIPAGIVVILLATTTALSAQGRGHHGGIHVRVGPPAQTAPAPGFARVRPPLAPVVRGAPFAFARPPRRVFVPPVFGYYSPFTWPSAIYAAPLYSSPIYAAPAYSSPAYTTQAAPQSPAPTQAEIDLAYQVGRLSQEIQQLRAEQALRSSQQPPSPVPERPATPTVLVFRDGHRIEIQNYAIVGQTLWIFDENASTKIPLSDLDLDATRNENRIRGLRFP